MYFIYNCCTTTIIEKSGGAHNTRRPQAAVDPSPPYVSGAEFRFMNDSRGHCDDTFALAAMSRVDVSRRRRAPRPRKGLRFRGRGHATFGSECLSIAPISNTARLPLRRHCIDPRCMLPSPALFAIFAGRPVLNNTIRNLADPTSGIYKRRNKPFFFQSFDSFFCCSPFSLWVPISFHAYHNLFHVLHPWSLFHQHDAPHHIL